MYVLNFHEDLHVTVWITIKTQCIKSVCESGLWLDIMLVVLRVELYLLREIAFVVQGVKLHITVILHSGLDSISWGFQLTDIAAKGFLPLTTVKCVI